MAKGVFSTFKNILLIASLALIIGYIVYSKFNLFDTVKKQDSTVVMTQINKVMKLVTVEGQFSELLKHEEYYGYNLPGLRKKVLIRVQAKVLAGYDLEKIDITLDDLTHTVHLKSWPEPEILSIDDQVDYYDISQGLFNTFDKDDYTEIQGMAEKKIKQAAIDSDIFETAEEQKKDVIELLELITKGAGWKLKIDELEPILH